MPHLLQETLSSPALATAVVRKLRAIMFPLSLDGSGRPPSPRPSSHLPPSSSSKYPMGKRPPLPSDEDAASGAWTAVDRSEADLTEEAEWDDVRLQIERSIPSCVILPSQFTGWEKGEERPLCADCLPASACLQTLSRCSFFLPRAQARGRQRRRLVHRQTPAPRPPTKDRT
jgi:hypothetical protein